MAQYTGYYIYGINLSSIVSNDLRELIGELSWSDTVYNKMTDIEPAYIGVIVTEFDLEETPAITFGDGDFPIVPVDEYVEEFNSYLDGIYSDLDANETNTATAFRVWLKRQIPGYHIVFGTA
jgi:hypothetical protein